jgi:RNA polymerase sigma-70 factor (ECF subfamily)
VHPQTENAQDKVELVQRLFIEHAPEVRGFVVALLPDLCLAEDVVQETFITAIKRAAVFDSTRNFLPWACGIARNKIFELGRSAPRQWQPLSEKVIEALSAEMPPVEEEDSRLQHLDDCMAELAPQARRIVELCYSQARKPGEIARELGWRPESIYVALSRARVALRDCVQRKLLEGGGPP